MFLGILFNELLCLIGRGENNSVFVRLDYLCFVHLQPILQN